MKKCGQSIMGCSGPNKWSVVFMFVFVIIASVIGSLLRLPPKPPIIPPDELDVEPFYNVSEDISDTDSVDDDVAYCDPLWLMRVFDGADAAEFFAVERVINALPTYRNAISVSLYCKADGNKFVDEAPDPSREFGGAWHNDVMEPLLRLIEDVVSRPELRGFKVRIHLAKDLSLDKAILQQLDNKRVEVYVMGHSSIGAQPGRLWRFLSWDDAGLDTVCNVGGGVDIDTVLVLYKVFEKHKNHAALKLYNDNAASALLARPRRITASSMTALMKSYVSYAVARSSLKHTARRGEDWRWHSRGFDARFVGDVVMPALLKQGLVVVAGTAEAIEASGDEEARALKRHPNNAVVRVKELRLE